MKGSLVAQNKQSRKGDAPLIAWFWVKTEGLPSGNRETERKRERESEKLPCMVLFMELNPEP